MSTALQLQVSPDLILTDLGRVNIPREILGDLTPDKDSTRVQPDSKPPSNGQAASFHDPVLVDFPAAVATAKLQIDLLKTDPHGQALFNLLEKHGGKLTDFEIKLHIRSFLARSGIDGFIKYVTYTPKKFRSQRGVQPVKKNRFHSNGEPNPDDILGSIEIGLDYHFLHPVERNNGLQYPLHKNLRDLFPRMKIAMANLIFRPPDLKPLSESEIGDAKLENRLFIPNEAYYNHEKSRAEVPIGDAQYPVGITGDLSPADYPSFLTDGKRYLVRYQSALRAAGNYVRQFFDVWGIDLSSPDNSVEFLLDRATSNPKVWHVASPYLNLKTGGGDQEKRHFEFRTKDRVPTKDLAVVGQFYPKGERLTPVVIGAEFPKPQKIEVSNAPTLNETLHKDPDVLALLKLLDELYGEHENGLRGLLVGMHTSYLLPYDPTSSLFAWARFSAKEKQALDKTHLKGIQKQGLDQAILDHPGTKALQAALAGAVSHNTLHILLSSVLPSADEVRDLAIGTGAGVGAFLCHRLTASPDRPMTSPIESYSKNVKKGDCSIYWLPENDKLRKLISSSWVQMDAAAIHGNLDFVLGFYFPHLENQKLAAAAARQIRTLLAGLSDSGQNIGIACGSATGQMNALIEETRKKKGFYSIGITDLCTDETASFKPHALTVCPKGDLNREGLLAGVSDLRIALNGGFGTMGQLLLDASSMRFGNLPSAPLGLIDSAGIHNFQKLGELVEDLGKLPATDRPFSPPWTRNLFQMAPDIEDFTRRVLGPYLANPLEWMADNGIPPEIQKKGLEAHLLASSSFGRKPSIILVPALHHFKLI